MSVRKLYPVRSPDGAFAFSEGEPEIKFRINAERVLSAERVEELDGSDTVEDVMRLVRAGG